MNVHHYENFDALPRAVREFLNSAGDVNFFDSVAWFRIMSNAASPEGDQISIFVADEGGQPAAVLVAKRRNDAGALRSRMLLSPSHALYTPLYGPVLHDGSGNAGLREIISTIARTDPPFHVLRFDSLDSGSSIFDLLVKEFKSEKMTVQPFFNFHNWFEDVGGKSIGEYLAERSVHTRCSINRHVRRLERSGRARFVLVTGGPRLTPALLDYALVDLQSWKPPEPYSSCVPEIVQCAARAGALRLGLLYVDDEPAAAQIWIVSGGKATIFRLHYASKFAKLAVGTVLTYEMFRHIIENDRVKEINFGRGNEPFKKQWLKSCRKRSGLLVFNPRTIKGCLIASRHVGGHILSDGARRLGILERDTPDDP